MINSTIVRMLVKALRGEGPQFSPWLAYPLSAVLVAGATLLRLVLMPENAGYGFITLYPLIIVIAFLLGPRPALFALVLSAIGADFLFISPLGVLNVDQTGAIALAIYCVSGVMITWIANQARRTYADSLTARALIDRLTQEQKAIIESHVVGIVRIKNRTIVWCNTAFAAMFGYTPTELIGRPTRILYLSDAAHLEFAAAAFPRISRGEIYRSEFQQVRKDGSIGWYDASVGLFGSGSNDQIGAFVDATARKEAQIALATSVTRLRSVFSAMSEGLIIQAHDGRLIDANPAAEMILSLSRDQLVGAPPTQSDWRAIRVDGTPFPADEHPAMVSLRTGRPVHHEIMGIHAPGAALRWISINAQPIFLAQGGQQPDAVVATFTDVTEARQLTEELRVARNDLEAILNNVPARITSWHLNLRNRFANHMAEASFGLAPGQVSGKSLREIIGEQRFAMASPKLDAALAGEPQSFENAEPAADGASLYSQTTYVPKWQGDAVVGLYAFSVDITELRNSHERIRELAQRLESVREEERRAAAHALHEGISQDMFAAALMVKGLAASVQDHADLSEACRELTVIIDQCLSATRQIANDLRPSGIAHLELSVVLREHAQYFGKMSGLAIEIVKTSAFPRLDEATRLLFFRAAQEVLTNVARHAQAHAVEIVLGSDTSQVTMAISDDGIGIDDGALERPGSLGLLGIRERFRACGGTVTVQRQTTKGTIVWMCLPAAQVVASSRPS
jgi:PAS domain S-box-containing protein